MKKVLCEEEIRRILIAYEWIYILLLINKYIYIYIT